MAQIYSADLQAVPAPAITGYDAALASLYSTRADPAVPTADSTSAKQAVHKPAVICTDPAVPVAESTGADSTVPMLTFTDADPAVRITFLPSTDPAVPMADSTSAKPTVLMPSVGYTDPAVPVAYSSVYPTVPRAALAITDPAVPMTDSTSADPVPARAEGAQSLECLPRAFDVERASFQSMLAISHPKETKKRDRKQSKYINTQPLYQEYWSQCTGMDTRPGGTCFRVDMSLSMAGLVSTSLLSPPQMSPRDYAFSFWQEIPQVKGSGLLDRISPQERRLQEAVFEVVTSEASYLRSLSVAVNHFQRSNKLTESLRATEAHTLFSNLQQVKDVSERFLLELEEQLEWDVYLADIGDIVLKHCPSFHKVYVPYVTNQMYQERLVQHLMQDNMKFVHVLQKLEHESVCQRQTLKSFLVLPFQRITRLKILLESILKQAQGGSVMTLSVGKALVAVGQIVWECNENIGRMKQTEELVLLEKRVQFLKTKSIPLISRGRWLLRQGTLSQILFHESGPGHRPQLSTMPIHLHLFCDLLLLSRRRESGHFLVEDYACPRYVKAEHFKAKALGLPATAFMLCLLRNHAGASCNFILEAASENEKQEWVSQLSSQMGSTGPPNVSGPLISTDVD